MIHAADYEANLLIVDDDPLNIRAIARCLPKNYHFREALSGEEALHILGGTDPLPDIIILDMKMPGLSGLDVCRIIKLNDLLKNIPVIFLSGAVETESKLKAFAIGGVDYITKPYAWNELLARIDIHLQHLCLQRKFKSSNEHLEELVLTKVGEIYKLQTETIFALTNLVNCRNNSTGFNLSNIQAITKLLASKLKENPTYTPIIDNSFIFKIFSSSPLYEIGSVGVPDSILFKTDPLSEEELIIMRSHTVIGSETLKEVKGRHPSNGFIDMGIEITLSHHEKWDGTGYPHGLKGNKIPLSAQLVSLAETYDTLLTDCPAKKACSSTDAWQQIVSASGSFFNPDIVAAFIDCEKEIRGLYQ